MSTHPILNIALPVEAGLIHATPVAHATFEKYFDVIARAHSEITGGGFSNAAGSKIAYLMLKKIATDLGLWSGPEGVANGLMNEIYRLSNFISESEQGWQALPLFHAIQQGQLDDEKDELAGALVFFNLVSLMEQREDVPVMVNGLAIYNRGRTTTDDCTAFMATLKVTKPAPAAPSTPSIPS